MKSFIKGIAANYLKSSDRLHAEKMSNTCKKISKRAETTNGKPNLMRLKVVKCVKILLFPPIERAVKV